MKEIPVTRIEFFGGPEDGRVLDVDALRHLAGVALATGAESIPMLVESDSTGDSERGKVHLTGLYVPKSTIGSTLQYHWSPVPA